MKSGSASPDVHSGPVQYRPFRSFTFWLGVPGLLFLVWAWVDSMSYLSFVARRVDFIRPSGLTLSAIDNITHRTGAVKASWSWAAAKDVTRLPRGLEQASRSASKTKNWFPPANFSSTLSPSIGARQYTWVIPHWLLLLCYTVTWALLVIGPWFVVKRTQARVAKLQATEELAPVRPKRGRTM